MSRQVVKCDCCYVRGWPAIMWTYEIEPFGFDFSDFPESPDPRIQSYQDDGFWAFCDDCHQLVEAGDRRGLMARAEVMEPAELPYEKEWRRRMFLGFFNAKRRCSPYRGHPLRPVDGSTQARWN
jgi:hypothetical protein